MALSFAGAAPHCTLSPPQPQIPIAKEAGNGVQRGDSTTEAAPPVALQGGYRSQSLTNPAVLCHYITISQSRYAASRTTILRVPGDDGLAIALSVPGSHNHNR